MNKAASRIRRLSPDPNALLVLLVFTNNTFKICVWSHPPKGHTYPYYEYGRGGGVGDKHQTGVRPGRQARRIDRATKSHRSGSAGWTDREPVFIAESLCAQADRSASAGERNVLRRGVRRARLIRESECLV